MSHVFCTTHSRTAALAALAAWCVVAGPVGCKHTIAVEPIEVKPIHLTLDINLKVDRELDEFFDYEDQSPTTATAPATTVPAPGPTSAPTKGGAS